MERLLRAVEGFVDKHLRAMSPRDVLKKEIQKKIDEAKAAEAPHEEAVEEPEPSAHKMKRLAACLVLGIVAVIASVTAAVVWQETVIPATRAAWSMLWHCRLQATGAALLSGALVVLGMYSPMFSYGHSWRTALEDSISKTALFIMMIAVPVGVCYADIGTDVLALKTFWDDGFKEFFGLNLLGIILAACYYSVLLWTSFKVEDG